MPMGLTEFIKQKQEEFAAKNKAKHDAMREFYESEEYKRLLKDAKIKKLKEGKSNDFISWLKRVSNNAAKLAQDNSIKFDAEKIIGKQKKDRDKK
jgi:hypothetical protein